MQINLNYDSSVNAAPAAFKVAMAAAARFLDELIANPITLNILVGWGEDDNGAFAIGDDLSLGGALAGINLGLFAIEKRLVGECLNRSGWVCPHEFADQRPN